MPLEPFDEVALLLLAASTLGIARKRLRALARGEDAGLREWIAGRAHNVTSARESARADAELLDSLGAKILTLTDEAYPPGLRDLRSPPAFLTVRGNLPPSGIAVVGSRKPPKPAQDFARDVARLARIPVIAGLALGIDAAAHRGALASGTPTLAYVGTGLRNVYPPEHVDLQDRILAGGGAIASERLPSATVTDWALVQRDRLQAAHARLVLLIASERNGGAMHTMRFAAELGRPRFALREEGGAEFEGNLQALASGAIALEFDAKAAAAALTAEY